MRLPLFRTAVALALATAAAVPSWTARPAEAAAALPTSLKVNAGGPAYVSTTQGKWAADTGFVGGRVWSTRSAIAGTSEPALFQTQRYGMSAYRLSAASGLWRVKLHLAEGYFSARGKRVFDVSAEGTTVLRGIDIYAASGHNRAYQARFDVPVTDGELSIDFAAVKDVPAVAAIEAYRLGPAPEVKAASETPTTTTVPATTSTVPPTSTTQAPAPAPTTTTEAPAPTTTTQAPAPAPTSEAPLTDGTTAHLYVSPSGANTNAGTSAAAPLKTIQAALDKAMPGTTIHLAAGVYDENLATVRSGTAADPITIQGPETGKDRARRYQAVLFASSRVVSINHSYIRLRGFTIDGQKALDGTAYPTELSSAWAFKEAQRDKVVDGRLVYIGAADTSHDLTGIVIDDMFLNGAGGECVRMRNNANHNVVSNSTIQYCGLYGKDATDTFKYHNGEGVYIGTSPKSTSQPMHANDQSSFNLVTGNTIHTYGSECMDVKENAHDNTFSGNDCGFNDEPVSYVGSNLEVRGYDNAIVGNRFQPSSGYGLKFAADSSTYPTGGNVVISNTFAPTAGATIYNKQASAQGVFCGNVFAGALTVYGGAVGAAGAACI